MLTFSSPAKINLFLRVLNRRDDGFHELASLFQAINLCDTIHFSLSDQDELTCTDPSLPTDGSNLIMKALQLFRNKTKLNFSIKIHLEKKIPHQAGLGGGSGNAATTLWALNTLMGSPASTGELLTWSSEIGSDIPFFFSEGTAYCTGRGESVQSLPSLPPQTLWIVKPPQGTSTPEVYRKLDLSQLVKRHPEETLQEFLKGSPHYFNDLEEAAFKALPELFSTKQKLLKLGFDHVLLSGSGSSFFCLGNPHTTKLNNFSFYSVSFINRSFYSWYS
jgi:4-diphosphocytidyl-2-C-methyl-D-erythritol kinase